MRGNPGGILSRDVMSNLFLKKRTGRSVIQTVRLQRKTSMFPIAATLAVLTGRVLRVRERDRAGALQDHDRALLALARTASARPRPDTLSARRRLCAHDHDGRIRHLWLSARLLSPVNGRFVEEPQDSLLETEKRRGYARLYRLLTLVAWCTAEARRFRIPVPATITLRPWPSRTLLFPQIEVLRTYHAARPPPELPSARPRRISRCSLYWRDRAVPPHHGQGREAGTRAVRQRVVLHRSVASISVFTPTYQPNQPPDMPLLQDAGPDGGEGATAEATSLCSLPLSCRKSSCAG